MNLFIHEAAEEDILCQIEWYAEQGLTDVSQRFGLSVISSINAMLDSPQTGASRMTRNPALIDLRTWPVSGFSDFRVYYLLRGEQLQVIRVLHSKRNTDAILEEQSAD